MNDNLTELWKPIVGYEELYEVSNSGNVRSFHYGKANIIKLFKLPRLNVRYSRVTLTKDGIQKPFSVHRLVAEAFIAKQINKLFVNHLDSNTQNNSAENLEWCNQRDNLLHCVRNNRKNPVKGEQHGRCKLKQVDINEIRKLKDSGLTFRSIAEKYNLSQSGIKHIVYNHTWK